MNHEHAMVLESISPIGTEEWYCPICARRVLKLSWHPDARSLVVDPGDETATHLQDGQLAASSHADGPPLVIAEEQRLTPWVDWLEGSDFESLWR
jgi:hypothetical protein